ncbi:hypothetical protein NEIG_01035 [Nematocida sp. ERTm5]|nr:hypothetical protein NEIG_01035 [Nematocida sp. ERTm5]
MGTSSRKDAVCARRMSVGSVDSQSQEISNMLAYFTERPALVEEMREDLQKIIEDPAIQKINRRHSDQFRTIETNRLSQEMDKNRKLRLIHKFEKENKNISDVTDQWREVLLTAFEDLAKYTHAPRTDLYKAFHFKAIHVDKEEVGIYSDYESETENE